MNLRQQAAEIKSAMQAIVDGAKAESRDLTEDEANTIEAKAAEHAAIVERAEKAEKAARTVAELASAPVVEEIRDEHTGAKDALGMRIAKSEAFAGFRKAHPSGVGSGTPIRIEAKNVGTLADVGLKATLDTTTGQVQNQRQPGYQNTLIDNQLSLLDLITIGNTNASIIEYAQITAETDNAAIVAEGELKPLSDVTTALADAKAFTYADGFDATNQMLADDGALATFMQGRITFHIRNEIERVLLSGAGTATEPAGILNTTGVQAQAFDTDVVTTIARALGKVEDVNADPQAVVMNPADLWSLRLLREDGASGGYLAGGPFNAGAAASLWGVPLVASRRVTAGTALVGNFRSVNFLQREPLSVLAFNQHKDYAQRNMVYVRAELRGMQLFYSPREVVVADLTAV